MPLSSPELLNVEIFVFVRERHEGVKEPFELIPGDLNTITIKRAHNILPIKPLASSMIS